MGDLAQLRNTLARLQESPALMQLITLPDGAVETASSRSGPCVGPATGFYYCHHAGAGVTRRRRRGAQGPVGGRDVARRRGAQGPVGGPDVARGRGAQGPVGGRVGGVDSHAPQPQSRGVPCEN
jgi:hypothetical protein